MGRGTKTAKRPGNVQFRHIAWAYKPRYLQADRDDKRSIAAEVFEEIAHLNPPGRFLDKVSDQRCIVSCKNRALEKICQFLREKEAKAPMGCQQVKVSNAMAANRKVKPRKAPTKPRDAPKRKITPTKRAKKQDTESEWLPPSKKAKVESNDSDADESETAPTAKAADKKLQLQANPTKRGKMIVKMDDDEPSAAEPITKSSPKSKSKSKASSKRTATKAKKSAMVKKKSSSSSSSKKNKKTVVKPSIPGGRQSLRLAISKSAKEVKKAAEEATQAPNPEPATLVPGSTNTAPMVESLTKVLDDIVPTHLVTPKPAVGRTPGWKSPPPAPVLQHPAMKPVPAFEEEDPCQLPDLADMTEDWKNPPILPVADLLRGLSNYSFRAGGGAGGYVDNFERDIEGITAPPLTSFTSRGISSCSNFSGFSAIVEEEEDDQAKQDRESPKGVTEISGPTNLKMHNSLFTEDIKAAVTNRVVGPSTFGDASASKRRSLLH